MKKLPKKFTLKGYTHTQLKREGDCAIYSQCKDDACYYEVIKIRTQEESEWDGIKFQAKELYPSSADWGLYGWTCKDAGNAYKVYDLLKSGADMREGIARDVHNYDLNQWNAV